MTYQVAVKIIVRSEIRAISGMFSKRKWFTVFFKGRYVFPKYVSPQWFVKVDKALKYFSKGTFWQQVFSRTGRNKLGGSS